MTALMAIKGSQYPRHHARKKRQEKSGRGVRIRTSGPRFWRPML